MRRTGEVGLQEARKEKRGGNSRSVSTSPRAPVPSLVLLVVIALALSVGVLWGGLLSDRITTIYPSTTVQEPKATGLSELIGVPAALLLIAIAFPLAFWWDHRIERPTAAGIGFGLLLLWSALSLSASRYLYVSLHALAILAASLALGVAVVRAGRSVGATYAVLGTLIGVASIVAGIGVQEYLYEWHAGNSSWRVFATFLNPDFLAGFLTMTIPVTAAMLLAARERALLLLMCLALGLQVVCLLETGSRFGLLALVCALLVFAALAAWSRRRSAADERRSPTGSARRRTGIILGLLALALIFVARPLLHRLATAGTEAYSLQFRLYTWRGTARMAQAHPLLGTGIGTFETGYPPYAEVGTTKHAHSSFLQLAGEIGYPGLLLFLGGLVGTLAIGVGALQKDDLAALPGGAQSPPITLRLLLVGVIAGIIGAIVHNLVDSDLYIPANALTFSVLCGLALALAGLRFSSSSPSTAVSSFGPALRIAALAAGTLLAAHALLVGGGRLQAFDAEKEVQTQNYTDAVAGYRAATSLDGGNPEYHLRLAAIYKAGGQAQAARQEYERAIRLAPVGRMFHLYGRFLEQTQDLPGAIRMHEQARKLDPNNLQYLLDLADDYRAANRTADATAVYAYMVRLYHSPVATVRALPQLVNWEFGEAYLGLAEAAIARGDRTGAEPDLRAGATVLDQFWRARNLQDVQLLVPRDVLHKVALRYDWALEQWIAALKALGRTQEATEVEARRATFKDEMEKEFSK